MSPRNNEKTKWHKSAIIELAFKKLSKFFQRLDFKIFLAICFQKFERSEMAKTWKLIAFKILLTKIRLRILVF